MVVTGGCLCGRVRYRAEGEPLFAVLCHCRDCQRASGAGHVPVLGMAREGFGVEGATVAIRSPGGSGHMAVRNRCAACGSLLFGTPEGFPEMATIYVGTLDDPSIFRPTASVNTGAVAPWDRVIGAAP